MTKKDQTRKKYGLLPPKIAESDPWVMVCVDLMGPFTIRTPAKKHSLRAVTMIDPEINTGWFEIVQTNYMSLPADHKQMQSLREYTKLSMTFSDHLTWKKIMKN
jgi:hypothetical protein